MQLNANPMGLNPFLCINAYKHESQRHDCISMFNPIECKTYGPDHKWMTCEHVVSFKYEIVVLFHGNMVNE
jgi:hypothetical protein